MLWPRYDRRLNFSILLAFLSSIVGSVRHDELDRIYYTGVDLSANDRDKLLELREGSESIDYARLYELTSGSRNNSHVSPEIQQPDTPQELLVKRASRVQTKLANNYEADEIVGKTPEQLVRQRGFETKTYYVPTKDGYHIHLVRVINPKISRNKRKKRPVIFNHGLFESATIWLLNSHDVIPSDYIETCEGRVMFTHGSKGSHYRNGPMMLANAGYDVWLMSMRGTDFSVKHDKYDSNDPRFWHYSLDHFALIDVPSVVNYVRKLTKNDAVAYIGHSQATFAIFALLAFKPEYSNVIKPVIAIAPVSNFKYVTSLAKYLLKGVMLLSDPTKDGPFPGDAPFFRRFNYMLCNDALINTLACQMANALIAGSGRYWPRGYYSHIPFFSSYQVLRHFSQLVKTNEFKMYDYSEIQNLKTYNSSKAPIYDLAKIQSQSIYLFSAQQDLLSTPADVEHIIRHLKYPPRANIVIGGKYNHFDLVTGDYSGMLVFEPILNIMQDITFANELNC